MITCNHVSADRQFDSDASVQAGAVNSERLSEGEISVSLYYIVFMYGRHWTVMMSDVLFFVSCIEKIVCMFAVMRFHILMFLVKVFSDFSSRYC